MLIVLDNQRLFLFLRTNYERQQFKGIRWPDLGFVLGNRTGNNPQISLKGYEHTDNLSDIGFIMVPIIKVMKA